MTKHPEFATLSPKDVEDSLPQRLFRQRLKGYHSADRLCRIYVLQIFKDARERGEFFVKWKNPADDYIHDGSLLFAHYFVVKYCKLHQPGMSVVFDSKGYIKSTSVQFKRVRRYIWAYRMRLARRFHDMCKQMFANTKYAPVAWEPLRRWLYSNPSLTAMRKVRLLNFNKADDDLHGVVAQCLWNLGTSVNLPWGRAATQPSAYSNIPISDKVCTSEYTLGWLLVYMFVCYFFL